MVQTQVISEYIPVKETNYFSQSIFAEEPKNKFEAGKKKLR